MRSSKKCVSFGCAASASTALVEVLVHLDADAEDLPTDLLMLSIEAPARIYRKAERVAGDDPMLGNEMDARDFGTRWLSEKRSALLLVPSVIVPMETNVLINPLHADASAIRLKDKVPFLFDPRLLKRRSVPEPGGK